MRIQSLKITGYQSELGRSGDKMLFVPVDYVSWERFLESANTLKREDDLLSGGSDITRSFNAGSTVSRRFSARFEEANAHALPPIIMLIKFCSKVFEHWDVRRRCGAGHGFVVTFRH